MDEFYQTRRGKRILLHAGKDATNKAFAFFDEDTIILADPTGQFGIAISKDFGTGIQGPLSLMMSPDEIRVAGLWKVNPLVLTALPSTIYTPIPWLRQSIPSSSKELVKGISNIIKLIV